MSITPVIRNVLFPNTSKQKGVVAIVEAEAISEVRRALFAWAYGTAFETYDEPEAHPEWSEEA